MEKKETYAEPILLAHDELRNITAGASRCVKTVDNTCVD